MAREYDGASGYDHLGSAAALDDLASGAFTVLAVIYPETTGEGGTGRIATKRGVNGGLYNTGGWLFFTDGTASLGFQTVSAVGVAQANNRGSANQITLNAWNRVAVTYDNAGDRKGNIYVSGTEISYGTDTAATGTIGSDADGDLTIGNTQDEIRTFDGFIAEIAVFNAVLSADIITAHARGWSALNFRANRVACVNMVRDIVDLHGNPITSSGTHNVQPHPSFIYPRRSRSRLWSGAAAAASTVRRLMLLGVGA